MRRFLAVFTILTVICGIAFSANAASIITSKLLEKDPYMRVLVFTWIAHTDGTVTATASTMPVHGNVVLVVTNPGGTAPQDDYDITITDEDGIDVMGGQCGDRDTSDSEQAIPLLDSTATIYGGRPVYGKLTLNISGNNVDSANGIVKVYIAR